MDTTFFFYNNPITTILQPLLECFEEKIAYYGQSGHQSILVAKSVLFCEGTATFTKEPGHVNTVTADLEKSSLSCAPRGPGQTHTNTNNTKYNRMTSPNNITVDETSSNALANLSITEDAEENPTAHSAAKGWLLNTNNTCVGATAENFEKIEYCGARAKSLTIYKGRAVFVCCAGGRAALR